MGVDWTDSGEPGRRVAVAFRAPSLRTVSRCKNVGAAASVARPEHLLSDEMTAFTVPRPGVLPAQWLDKAVGAGLIHWDRELLAEPSIQPASVDLHLGEIAYRLRC